MTSFAERLPYEWQIGWRYLRAGRRAGRRNRFISFIAGVSVLGIALGVAALIVVLSVMNGFQAEVRDRMLGVIAHVEMVAPNGRALADWQAVAREAQAEGGVIAAAPFSAAQVLLGNGETLRAALLRGVEPAAEARVIPLAGSAAGAAIRKLQPGERQIVLGHELARALGVKAGDSIGVLLPAPPVAGNEAAATPRTTPFTVIGTFDAGHFEYDNALAFVHGLDAQALLGLDAPAGVALRLADPVASRASVNQLVNRLSAHLLLREWTQANRTWFEAVQLQKRMLGLILVLIVAVAAFNLVSTLVMTVTDKRADIAILRTLGASPRSVMGIFFVQGAAAGALGTGAGVALGLAIATQLDVLVPAIERALGTRLLPPSVYFIDHMPSLPLASDIVPIAIASLALAFVATLYPSWRASRVQPALELRGE
jgi:lipoprotein-releasing system permease protein